MAKKQESVGRNQTKGGATMYTRRRFEGFLAEQRLRDREASGRGWAQDQDGRGGRSCLR